MLAEACAYLGAQNGCYGLFKDFAGPFATAFASCVAVVVTIYFQRIQAKIAQQQAETASHKLRLELYERRYEVYRAVFKLAYPRNLKNEEWETFSIKAYESRFLFNEEIFEKSKEIIAKANACKPIFENKNEYSDRQIECKMRDIEVELVEIGEKLPEIFMEYLDFKNIK